jgi:hypothetical protein
VVGVDVHRRALRVVFRINQSDVRLDEPDVFDRFDVVASGDADLGLLGVVAEDGAHVFVAPDAVRALAGDAVTPAWEEGFAAMLGYAASKGWLDDAGQVRAHVQRA